MRVNNIEFAYAPFDERIDTSSTVIFNKKTQKPLCVINIPFKNLPRNDKNFVKRVKNIIRKELEWKNTLM